MGKYPEGAYISYGSGFFEVMDSMQDSICSAKGALEGEKAALAYKHITEFEHALDKLEDAMAEIFNEGDKRELAISGIAPDFISCIIKVDTDKFPLVWCNIKVQEDSILLVVENVEDESLFEKEIILKERVE